MNKKKTIFTSSLLLIAYCCSSSFGVSGASFLNIPVGARAVGMGSAYSAVGIGVDSINWVKPNI